MELTPRQKALKSFYPLFQFYNKVKGGSKFITGNKAAPVSFYTLNSKLINHQEFNFNQLKGKKVLLVNTASDCGFTGQYSELQTLYEAHRDTLHIIAFPSNDFKQQEKGSNEEIAQFCQINYGVTFPLAEKSVVRKLPGQNNVFRWLTSKELNGWNDREPSWNFSKYLINEEGNLIGCFDPSVSPLSTDFINMLQRLK